MTWLWLIIAAVVLSFGFVVAFGAPYLPTFKKQVETALDLADLKPGETLLELGCGDGRVLVAAAHRGWRAVGYELNPILALLAWFRTRRYRGKVRIIWANFWCSNWPPADAIFTFLLPRYMEKLNKKVAQYPYQPVKLVSFAFKVPDRQIARTKDNVYLYSYK